MKRRMWIAALVVLMLVVAAIVLPGIWNDENKSPEQTSQNVAPASQGTGSGTSAAGVSVEAFKPIERKPRLLGQPNPGYPGIAQRARLEGTVFVKVLVDRWGNPKKALVVKSDSEVFNETARKAALQARFSPAVMNSGPVKCWVLIPYKFKLG